MRIVAIGLALGLGACATINNPGSVQGVYNLEALVGVAASALNGYRSLCVQKQQAVYPKCRTVVPLLQADLRVAKGQVSQALAYIKSNPGNTVGLSVVANQASVSLAQLRSDLKNNLPANLTTGL